MFLDRSVSRSPDNSAAPEEFQARLGRGLAMSPEIPRRDGKTNDRVGKESVAKVGEDIPHVSELRMYDLVARMKCQGLWFFNFIPAAIAEVSGIRAGNQPLDRRSFFHAKRSGKKSMAVQAKMLGPAESSNSPTATMPSTIL